MSDMKYASGDEAHSIVIGYELKVIGGELFCDGGETLELKYFAPDDMPELFCKQHEEFWRDITKIKACNAIQGVNMEYNFKKCEEADFDFIYELKEKCFRWYVEKIYGWNEDIQRQFLTNEMAKHLPDMNIIQCGGKDIGLFTFFYDENGDACVSTFAIMPEYQGKGIGTRILTKVLEENKDKRVYLQTFCENPARNLYQRMGFQKYGETETHWLMECKQSR